MITVIEQFNPLNLSDATQNESTAVTLRDYLKSRFGQGFTEFELPTIALLNGSPFMREHWNESLSNGDEIRLVRVTTGDPVTATLAIISVVTAAYSYHQAQKMKDAYGKNDLPESSPIYFYDGQQNKAKVGEIVEQLCGRNKHVPSHAIQPFNRFIDNEQWVFIYLCVCQGGAEVETLMVDDTDATTFEDLYFEVLQPDEPITLFGASFIEAKEVSSTELFAPNEDNYPVDNNGWTPSFVINDAGTEIVSIELDYSSPALFKQNDNGELVNAFVVIEAQYQKIDNNGEPLGNWVHILRRSRWVAHQGGGAHEEVTLGERISGDKNEPVQITRTVDVPAGRYRVRTRRTNSAATDTSTQDTMNFIGARGELKDDHQYPDTTRIAIKAKASNSLNNSIQNIFSCIATGYAPVWNGQAWEEKPSRSIVWNFVKILKTAYPNFPDHYLDLPHLRQLDADYTVKGQYFDYVFSGRKVTLWPALEKVARAGRAVPIIRGGSKISLHREQAAVFPQQFFNAENIVKGSISWQSSSNAPDEYDSTMIEYIDNKTWQEETVFCSLDGEGRHPQRIRLHGVTERQCAYREGLYLEALRRYPPQTVNFKTGREGRNIPSYGSVIDVGFHRFGKGWGQGGIVVGADDKRITLSEPFTLSASEDNFIFFRKKTGQSSLHYRIDNTDDPQTIQIIDSVRSEDRPYFDEQEPCFYQLGIATEIKQTCITRQLSSDPKSVSLSCELYDPRWFANDNADAPELGRERLTPVATYPSAPPVNNLSVRKYDYAQHLWRAQWSATAGAFSYFIRVTLDGDEIVRQVHPINPVGRPQTIEDTSVSFRALPQSGEIFVTVVALRVSYGRHAWWRGES